MNTRRLAGGLALVAMLAGCGGSSTENGGPAQSDGNSATGSSATSGSSSGASKPISVSQKKYFQIKAAKIEYVYTGAFEGKETFYFDDWGNTVAIIEDKTEFGNRVNQTSFWKDGRMTIYNHITRSPWEGKMRARATEPPAVATLKESQLASVGYKKLPNEDIAGKTCVVFENEKLKVKYWLWSGLELKIVNRSLGEGYTREATSVEENVTIPESLFALPEGYKN